ncbi:Carbon starvation protein [Azotobacter vinelandii CA]|uniref:Carbon starvation protein n=2 Tax=Azotobacter vinelandii TaxID=354 RepID=C1DEQ7_AZOVD|nr:carbon starvation CstA family protein [Azotobacter vinelandii]ACO80236.1 Carbon starvation protein [Azotobacter vinelandii DJ]AGK13357.1 Carbon starvation protein [Azotobacter vinelandii CA]AGK17707.1 Carbon starvation protein [Azotobacter vinelandii CA6]WKN21027.1 carbon starvation protein A [Azotobacter vinelandii]SFX72608.1 carbon starvation protein [Azotobacter vinelandii]
MNRLVSHLAWLALAVLGAAALGVVALRRGEAINALWIVVAATAIYLVAYRYYSLFIANRVMQLDPRRATPAVLNNDGLDFVPTNKHVLFGHHFAAIAGAGPLVGPVLAAQMGYLPGTLWLIAGVVLAGAVQDFLVLCISTRRNARSLGDMVREEMGRVPGTIALFGCFLIMIIILAVLALIVVKALAHSPWGMFTVIATIPIAMFMGLYMRYIRPGRIGEISLIGIVLLLASIWLGGVISTDPYWSGVFTFSGVQITWMLIGYGFVAAVLPVWLILAPRDYLSTFLKIGTIAALAVGIVILNPDLKMPAVTQFIDGSGPVWKGALFPFLFITIACGAVSGFHALIASGTTPKLLASEGHARYIGYGGMLMESMVAIMAMVAAAVIEPGVYFAMNSPPAIVGADAASVAAAVSGWGFAITPEALESVARDIGETTILARAGGAPTLAVGIAQILHQVLPGATSMAFWYHFAILFEALFILTAVDAGTRAGRFMLQDLLGNFVPVLRRTDSWGANVLATAGCVALWGYLLYQGVVDPLGGINTLWPLFGISNQMLAGIALMLCSVVLIKMKRQNYVWVTLLPAVWLLICTTVASLIKLFDPNPAVGFLALASKYAAAMDTGQVLAPARDIGQMQNVIMNAYTNAGLSVLFLVVVFSILFYSLKVGRAAWIVEQRTDKETPFQAIPGA